MTTNTHLTLVEIQQMLTDYALGQIEAARAIERGTVQTNYLLQAVQRRYVLKLYAKRSASAVQFEAEVLAYLA